MSFAHELEDTVVAGFNPEKDSETASSDHQIGKFVGYVVDSRITGPLEAQVEINHELAYVVRIPPVFRRAVGEICIRDAVLRDSHFCIADEFCADAVETPKVHPSVIGAVETVVFAAPRKLDAVNTVSISTHKGSNPRRGFPHPYAPGMACRPFQP